MLFLFFIIFRFLRQFKLLLMGTVECSFSCIFFCSYIIIEKKINLIGLLHTNILLIQQK